METISTIVIQKFLVQLGERYPDKADFYLLGGSALRLLGNPRETMDIDYTYTLTGDEHSNFLLVLGSLGTEMKLDLESVPLSEFIPLPPDTDQRHKFFGRYGSIDVYIFDLYSIALSKIARGFESDIEDVLFMWEQKLIDFDELERLYKVILPFSPQSDIIPVEFQAYFDEVRRRLLTLKKSI